MSTTTKKKENPFKWLWRYMNESREELRKVTWPSQKETTKYSLIVIILCLALAAFFGGLDYLLNLGLEWLILVTS
ncbi:preprotein translocase subunit SecE [Candidatus Uhrbacteria bacterium CG10_big_fil_rev_8_21_14_0_10_48_16]|uniref:Protein translocase subunit SecE n=1 Tax=Candidatus Uhrbacteria bacterium CG10_big_fil_rev_8_21_14_0_10_48_16 TaxID=1975038 RepID=A0A2M8LFY6_9BACT|nr:MAG: preprotein translocase subunit SecE [Candidatus Uhrbacteria bacterium CG10_big_fil_rev_8_21_14_0_10_48_16]